MRAFVKMMPRIEAGEQLAAISRSALSHNFGFEREIDRQEQLDALRRRAAGTAPPAPVKAEPADLAAMGIAISGGDADLPVIADLDAWLGNGEQAPSSSEAVGEQGRG